LKRVGGSGQIATRAQALSVEVSRPRRPWVEVGGRTAENARQ
jgi:hypothetical protein